MGRPVNSKYFGNTHTHSINVTAWTKYDTAGNAGFIAAQNSDRRFRCTTATGTDMCVLVNGAPAAAGEMSLQAFPIAGSGATATANLAIVSATVVNGGANFATGDTLTVYGGTLAPGANAAVLTVTGNANGAITTVSVTNEAAQNYLALPAMTDANVSATSGNGNISLTSFDLVAGVGSVVLDTAGTGYVAPVIVAFSGGGGSGASGTANIDGNGNITSVSLTANGSLYTSAPTVTFESEGNPLYIQRLSNKRVITFGNVAYPWLPKGVPATDTNATFVYLDTK